MNKPDCYKCSHRRDLRGSAHSRCNNHSAYVQGDGHGIYKGWFNWPLNYDPVWLESCDGFSDKPEDKGAPTKKLDPIVELMAMLR